MKIIFLLILCMLSPFEQVFSNQNVATPSIVNIVVENDKKVVAIHLDKVPASYKADASWKQPFNYRVDLKRGKDVYTNIVITAVKGNKNSIVLYTQLPLSAAIVSGNQDEFTVAFLKEQTANTTKKTVLGSVINPFNLRTYAVSDHIVFNVVGIFVFIFVISLIVGLEPLYRRFNFKRKYIKKFDIDKELVDPFTYVPIKPGDMVLAGGTKTMLLSSWKRISRFSEEIKANYKDFFVEYQNTNFFDPRSELSKDCFRAFFGGISVLVGWIFFMLLQNMTADAFFQLGASTFDDATTQLSPIFTKDIMLGMCIACAYGLFLTIADFLIKLYPEAASRYLVKGVFRVLMIFLGFVVQIGSVLYFFHSSILSHLIVWICISLFFHVAINPERKVLAFVQPLLLGIISFLIFELGMIDYCMNRIGISVFVFSSLLFLGVSTALLSGKTSLKIRNSIIK